MVCLSVVKARDVKVVRPIYGVELFDGETARYEVEISEDDVHGQWKLNGEVLSRSSVRFDTSSHVTCSWKSSFLTHHVIWQDVDIIEDGSKHTLILYNCRVTMTGEVVYTAANAKCSANLKVKGGPTCSVDQTVNQSQSKGRPRKPDLPLFLFLRTSTELPHVPE